MSRFERLDDLIGLLGDRWMRALSKADWAECARLDKRIDWVQTWYAA